MFSGGQNGTKQRYMIFLKSLWSFIKETGNMLLTPGKKNTGVIPEADCEQAFQYLSGRNKKFKSAS